MANPPSLNPATSHPRARVCGPFVAADQPEPAGHGPQAGVPIPWGTQVSSRTEVANLPGAPVFGRLSGVGHGYVVKSTLIASPHLRENTRLEGKALLPVQATFPWLLIHFSSLLLQGCPVFPEYFDGTVCGASCSERGCEMQKRACFSPLPCEQERPLAGRSSDWCLSSEVWKPAPSSLLRASLN